VLCVYFLVLAVVRLYSIVRYDGLMGGGGAEMNLQTLVIFIQLTQLIYSPRRLHFREFGMADSVINCADNKKKLSARELAYSLVFHLCCNNINLTTLIH
jgi:hypothetical protein